MRYTVWTHLLDLAQNEDELRRVIELAPKWKDVNRDKKDKGGLGAQWGEMVVTRAESLTCPQVALDMFSDHAKYQVPLSLPAARHLLHALHTKHSLEQVMTAVALYRVYNLTPIADDLVSLGLVCRALAGKIHPTQPPPASKSAVPAKPQALKTKTLQASKQVFQALIESLRELVSSTDPSLYSISSHARTRSLTPKFSERQERANKGVAALEKEKTWLKWCLQRIESNLRKTEDLEKINWLTQWRVAAGHIKTEPATV
ncbi:hypothetical protein BT96DRAFT_847466 [Gymnopus androsaceus JB14]|uniref:Uncharacterized protein n=1 Tax=Gymnopus androsaceus JB14 TaxID=1447944 RepID=A0A6A4INP4_9AGAR|nr:hypothetical protein BT96DRAFT_847466 [Gymnopus androsaceus JB14]